MRALRLAPLVLLASLLQCTDFPALQSGACGNAVVETGEDCDTYPVGAGTYCRPPGSATGACRLDCTAGSNHVCPTGWGCGTDGICRQPTGTFRQANGPVEANAWRLLTGDFDGNGRQDVFVRAALDGAGQSSSRILYYQPTQGHGISLASTVFLPLQIASPVLADFNADKRTDLGCVISGGIDVMLGQPDGTVSPVAYPAATDQMTEASIAVVQEYGPSPTEQIVLFVATAGMDLGILSRTNPRTGIQKVGAIFSTAPKGPADLAGPMITARFVEDPTLEACDQLVLAFAGEDGADVYSPCAFQGSTVTANEAPPIAHVGLPGGLTVQEGVRAGDVDGDGHQDLLIGADAFQTFVALGDGKGGFAAPTKLVVTAGTALLNPVRFPVAVGDLNGDGKADFVYPNGIYTSDPGGTTPYYRSAAKTGGLWTEGAIADVNADGLPDVVAASDTELDVDVYIGNGTIALDPFVVPTTGQVQQIAIGDFDGDRVNDIGIAESPTDSSLPNDASIAWGQARAKPSDPARVGQFDTVSEAVALQHPFTTLSDLVVLAHPAATPDTTLVSVLLGNGDRQPIAPYFLSTQNGPNDVAIALAAGSFLGSPNLDIAAVGYTSTASGYDFHDWIAPGIGQAQLQPPTASGTLPTGFEPYSTLTGAGRDVTLTASASLDPHAAPVFVTAAPDGALTSGAFLTASASPGNPPTISPGAINPFAVSVTDEGQLEFHDVDGDGAVDAVLLAGFYSDRMRAIYVAWNDGKGNYSASRALQVNTGTDTPEGFAFVTADTSGMPRIAYVTRHSLVLATVDAKGRSISSRTTLLATVSATGVAAGDVDGDGVQDLAVADDGNVTILRDVPVLE